MPPFEKEKYSVIQQMKKVEEAIKSCYKRVEILEGKLKTNELHPAQQESVKTELKEVRKLLKSNEENLKILQKQNMKTFAFAAAFCFICFVIYTFYILVIGTDN